MIHHFFFYLLDRLRAEREVPAQSAQARPLVLDVVSESGPAQAPAASSPERST